jgi:hypothetical protein
MVDFKASFCTEMAAGKSDTCAIINNDGRIVARNRHVLKMSAVVHAPAVVPTEGEIRLVSDTFDIV